MRIFVMSAVFAAASLAIAPIPKSVGIGGPAFAQQIVAPQIAQDRLMDRDRQIDRLQRELRDCRGSDCDRIREELQDLERTDNRDQLRDRMHSPDRGDGDGRGGQRGGGHGRGGDRD